MLGTLNEKGTAWGQGGGWDVRLLLRLYSPLKVSTNRNTVYFLSLRKDHGFVGVSYSLARA